jgi:hypothetical protein
MVGEPVGRTDLVQVKTVGYNSTHTHTERYNYADSKEEKSDLDIVYNLTVPFPRLFIEIMYYN